VFVAMQASTDAADGTIHYLEIGDSAFLQLQKVWSPVLLCSCGRLLKWIPSNSSLSLELSVLPRVSVPILGMEDENGYNFGFLCFCIAHLSVFFLRSSLWYSGSTVYYWLLHNS